MNKLVVVLLLTAVWYSPPLHSQSNLKPLTTELLRIAGKGDVAHVQQLLTQGADVNAHDSDGLTALITAAQLGDSATVKLLLDKGAQINANANGNGTALIYALEGFDKNADMKLQVATAKVLLEHNADVNITNQYGMTPLMIAAQTPEELPAARWLLTCGANVNVKDKRGMTALQYAVRDQPMIRLLRAHGAR